MATPWIELRPPWPARPYRLACPALTPQAVCDRLSDLNATISSDCSEPERETQEVLSSLLLGCDKGAVEARCLYVDVGCNIGYFASQAAALGADVACYEPTPFFCDAARHTIALNGFRGFHVEQAAIVSRAWPGGTELTFRRAIPAGRGPPFMPCDVGLRDLQLRHETWTAPQVELRRILAGRRVTLLKIDIDANEGELLHETVRMLASGETAVRSMLIELGSQPAPFEACAVPRNARKAICQASNNASGGGSGMGGAYQRRPVRHPRGGDVHDLYRLVHDLGYCIWRVNIHVNREMLNGRGENVNEHMSPQHPSFEPYFHVRAMRKVERLRPSTPREHYASLLGLGQSLLITRERLEEPLVTHHAVDLEYAGIGGRSRHGALAALNRANKVG